MSTSAQIASTMDVMVDTMLLLQYWSQSAHAGGAPAPWAEVRSR